MKKKEKKDEKEKKKENKTRKLILNWRNVKGGWNLWRRGCWSFRDPRNQPIVIITN